MPDGLWSQFDSSEAVILIWISWTKKKNQKQNGNTKDNGEEKISDFFIFFLFKFIQENIELWNLSQLIKRNMNQKEISWRQEAESINLK